MASGRNLASAGFQGEIWEKFVGQYSRKAADCSHGRNTPVKVVKTFFAPRFQPNIAALRVVGERYS